MSSMESQEIHSPSNSVLLQKPYEGSGSFPPPLPVVPEETPSRSSLSDPKDSLVLVPLLDSANGSSSISDELLIHGPACSSASIPSSPSHKNTHVLDQSCAPPQSSSLGVEIGFSVAMISKEAEEVGDFTSMAPRSPNFDDNYEEEQEEDNEPPPSSPVNLVGNNLSNYEPTPWSSSSSWSSGWASSSKQAWVSAESSSYIQETKPSMVGAGLANLGNTCFLNAVLQCFTHTVPLVQCIRSTNHAVPCERGKEGFCVICTLRDHVEISLASPGRIVSPIKLVNNLNHFSSYFQRYRQEDAHEFLQCFLDKLERCCLDSKTDKNCSDLGDENLVKRVFGGSLISKLRCCNCGHCSDTYEPLIDLSLEIENVDALPSALESFTKLEKIEDSETRFTCENCKEEVAVEKQLMVDKAPTIAAFHLKRFKNDGSYVEKIDKHVEYPMELDLKPYTNSTNQDNVELKYDLYAVIVHVGFSSTSGHYFCFVRSSPDTWYRLDDSKVAMVREEFVLSQDAYILFYAKCGTPSLSSLMEAQKLCFYTNNMNTSPQSVLDNVESAHNPYSIETGADIFYEDDFRDAGAGTSSWYMDGARHEGIEVNNTSNAAAASECNISGPEDERIGLNDSGSDRVVDPSMPQGERNSNEATCNDDKKCNTLPLVRNCHKETNEEASDVFHPLTPPRSKSPDTFSLQSQELGYQIPRDHLKVVEKHVACKRPSNKILEDSQKQEAIRYLKKSVPSSRGSKLALLGPQSQGPMNKKIRLERACKKASTSNTSHKSGMRPVATSLR